MVNNNMYYKDGSIGKLAFFIVKKVENDDPNTKPSHFYKYVPLTDKLNAIVANISSSGDIDFYNSKSAAATLQETSMLFITKDFGVDIAWSMFSVVIFFNKYIHDCYDARIANGESNKIKLLSILYENYFKPWWHCKVGELLTATSGENCVVSSSLVRDMLFYDMQEPQAVLASMYKYFPKYGVKYDSNVIAHVKPYYEKNVMYYNINLLNRMPIVGELANYDDYLYDHRLLCLRLANGDNNTYIFCGGVAITYFIDSLCELLPLEGE